MDNATIQEFLDEHDYDIRKTHNGRWIDQNAQWTLCVWYQTVLLNIQVVETEKLYCK